MKKFSLLLFIVIITIFSSCNKDEDEIVELKTPLVETQQVTDGSVYSIRLNGKTIDSRGSNITEVGFVVGYSNLPTITHNDGKFISSMITDNTFYMILQSLPSQTTLYIRAYAINSNGVGYGNEIIFLTFLQKIYDGDIEFNSQTQIDQFGMQHYNIIDGEVKISGGINNLNALNDLVIIDGPIDIRNTSLTNFSGLENLKSIGSGFGGQNFITKNPSLIDCSGLDNLENVNGHFYITENNSLVNFNGLQKLEYISIGSFYIGLNPNQTSLFGLENLKGVSRTLLISDNSSLTNITSLSNLKRVYELNISNNGSLQNLNGLQGLTSVNRIDIVNNSQLVNLSGFDNLERVDWVISIKNNTNLTTLEGVEKLTRIGYTNESSSYLIIKDNPNLTTLNGIHNLDYMGSNYRNIEINNNSTLTNFCALKKVILQSQTFYNFIIVNNANNPSLSFIMDNCP